MNMLEATIRVIQAATGPGPGLAIVMHPLQYRQLCEDAKEAAPPAAEKPVTINNLAIWLHSGMAGPAVVDQRTLLMLRMVGAAKVT